MLMENDFLAKLLEKIYENSRFPKYQMERRIDIFFNFFLPEIFKHEFGEDYELDIIIPELPIKGPDSNRSANLDYFVVCKKMKTAFLVELKTYDFSFDSKQLRRYGIMQSDGISKIKSDVDQILATTSSNFRICYENLRYSLSTIADDSQLELVYLLPEMAMRKLQKVADKEGIKVRFITLESLKSINISGPYSHEWDIFKTSNLI